MIHDPIDFETRTQARAHCSCGWVSDWIEPALIGHELLAAMAELVDHHRADAEPGQPASEESRPCGCGCGGVMIQHEDGRWFCLDALLAEDGRPA